MSLIWFANQIPRIFALNIPRVCTSYSTENLQHRLIEAIVRSPDPNIILLYRISKIFSLEESYVT